MKPLPALYPGLRWGRYAGLIPNDGSITALQGVKLLIALVKP